MCSGVDTVAAMRPPTDSEASSTGSGTSGTAAAFLRALPGRRDDAVAIVNGLFGDTLEARRSPMATTMAIRSGAVELPLDRRSLSEAIGEVPISGRICVLVHGLMSTESIWGFPGERSVTYGTRLASEHDVTALSLRYNTGRHISVNGREFSRLLDDLCRAWPVRVREVNLIGHSMGGLVIRSACHYGVRSRPRGRWLPFGRRWTSRVRRVVLIGVPNDGAGLEAAVNSVSAALAAVPGPAARLLARGVDRRSSGIKDLRFGNIVDEDWVSADPRATERLHPHRPLRLRRAEHLVIAGSLTRDPAHPLARRLGDALVTERSATGASSDVELFPGASVRMFPSVTHNALAHHPDVAAAISDWW